VDQAQIPTLLGLAMNAVVMVFVLLGYFRRLATKDDIKELSDRLGKVETRQGALETRQGALETGQGALVTRQDTLEKRIDAQDSILREIGKKADASMDLHHSVRGDLKVLQASVNRLESYFETPKLKSS
jgi:chromosome segregation ATPase